MGLEEEESSSSMSKSRRKEESVDGGAGTLGREGEVRVFFMLMRLPNM